MNKRRYGAALNLAERVANFSNDSWPLCESNCVPSHSTFTFNGLALSGGDGDVESSGGGAIYSTGNLTVKNTVITGNASQSPGGGIATEGGNLTIEEGSVITDNFSASGGGGGIFFDGDVDQNDYALWVQKNGYTLELFEVSV